MIRTEISNIDHEKYIYQTDLKFADKFCQHMLFLALENESNFIFRNNYIDPLTNTFDLYKKIGKQNSKLLIKRGRQIKEKYQNQLPIQFNQYFLKEDHYKEFLSHVPNFLKTIASKEPEPIFQISYNGNLLPPHRGHKRKCSLFMLLQGGNEETRWYKEKEPFDVVSEFRIPDLDKIEHVVTARIEPMKWYVFNHLEWHSVHKFSNSKRISIGLDFNSISAEQLVEIIKNASTR